MTERIALESVASEFSLDRITGTAHAASFRISALDHEAGDYTVEDQAVIKALSREGEKIVYGVRGNFGLEFRFDDAAVFHGDCDNWILCHSVSSFPIATVSRSDWDLSR